MPSLGGAGSAPLNTPLISDKNYSRTTTFNAVLASVSLRVRVLRFIPATFPTRFMHAGAVRSHSRINTGFRNITLSRIRRRRSSGPPSDVDGSRVRLRSIVRRTRTTTPCGQNRRANSTHVVVLYRLEICAIMTKNALRAVDAKTFSGKIHNDIKS